LKPVTFLFTFKMHAYVYYFLQLLPSDILGGCQSYIHRRYCCGTQRIGLAVYDDSGLTDLSNFSINYSLGNRMKLRYRHVVIADS